MVNTSTQTARNAEADHFNQPGYCLKQSRTWAGIGMRYPDAATAWRNVDRGAKHRDRRPPRGSAVYWVGGSSGYGHIAISLGRGRIRSTDAGGEGVVATRTLGWFTRHWTSLKYAGWSWDINEVTIPHPRPPQRRTTRRAA